MSSENEVTLNVYDLSAANDSHDSSGESGGGMSRFLTQRLLPSIGMGAYHTSLTIGTKTYTFAAQSGITSRNTSIVHGTSLPLIESISLGHCTRFDSGSSSSKVLNPILNQLRQFFTPTSYHLVSRNCNHFTEVLAMALLHPHPNNRYPAYINRLAKRSSSFLPKDDSNLPADTANTSSTIPRPCNVALEAQYAIQALESNTILSAGSIQDGMGGEKDKTRSQKKQLTEKQKAALAKLKSRSQQGR